VQGATALSPDVIATAYGNRVGREVTLAEVYDIANAITALYVQNGYAISFAVVPAQEIDGNGRVRIEVVEGYVSEVRFDAGGTSLPLPALAYGEAIKASRPLKTETLERYLLLLNDIPGITARGVFEAVPNGERGATRLAINLAYDHFIADAGIDNRGSRALGPFRANVVTTFNNMLGLGDSLRLRVIQTLAKDELTYLAGRYAVPVGNDGTILSLDVTYSDARPGIRTLNSIGFLSSGWIVGAQVEHPLLRRRANNLSLIAGATGKWLRSDIGTAPNSRDRVYRLNAGASFSQTDSTGVTTADAMLLQGLNVFDATRRTSPLRSRFYGDGAYTALDLTLSRLQDLGGGFDFLAAGTAHFAWRGLLASEQCGYGGAAFGRGFDDNELVGDGCAMATGELRYTTSDGLPFQLSALQFYVFGDLGIAWKEGPLLPGEVRNQGAQSIGGGMRLQFPGFGASVELAAPLSHDVAQEGNRDARVFFSVNKRFL
jgi:hemolysin activation/secretion protein